MKVKEIFESVDGITYKFIQVTHQNEHVESTYVNYSNKHIICFSTQFGCSMGCQFCANGLLNAFRANLSVEDMVSQCVNILKITHLIDDTKWDKPVLFSAMGCGEPSLNAQNVVRAMVLLRDIYPLAKFSMATMGYDEWNLSQMLYTLSVIHNVNFNLMISLHSAIEKTRKIILPSAHPLTDLMAVIKEHQASCGTLPVDYNVVLLDGINDSDEEADAVYKLLNDAGVLNSSVVKVNSYNKVNGCNFTQSPRVINYVNRLKELGVCVETYITNGEDIGAACGQLIAL